MTKLPWMPFLGFDYETDRRCKLLEPHEHGTYMLLMWEQWKEGSVPADPEEARDLLPGRNHTTETVGRMLERFFVSNGEPGNLVNMKLKELRDSKLAEHKGRQLGGRKTAKRNKREARNLKLVKDMDAEHPPEHPRSVECSAGGNQIQSKDGDIDPTPQQTTGDLPARAGQEDGDLFGDSLGEVDKKAQQAKANKEALNRAAKFVFSYCKRRWRKQWRKPDEKRLGKLRQRMRESSGDISELLYAADGAVKSSHLVDGGWLEISTVFRDREQVEKLATKGGYVEGKIHPTYQQAIDKWRADGAT